MIFIVRQLDFLSYVYVKSSRASPLVSSCPDISGLLLDVKFPVVTLVECRVVAVDVVSASRPHGQEPVYWYWYESADGHWNEVFLPRSSVNSNKFLFQ